MIKRTGSKGGYLICLTTETPSITQTSHIPLPEDIVEATQELFTTYGDDGDTKLTETLPVRLE